MLGLYLFGKAFVWCMKVLIICTAVMVMIAAAVFVFLAVCVIESAKYLLQKRATAT